MHTWKKKSLQVLGSLKAFLFCHLHFYFLRCISKEIMSFSLFFNLNFYSALPLLLSTLFHFLTWQFQFSFSSLFHSVSNLCPATAQLIPILLRLHICFPGHRATTTKWHIPLWDSTDTMHNSEFKQVTKALKTWWRKERSIKYQFWFGPQQNIIQEQRQYLAPHTCYSTVWRCFYLQPRFRTSTKVRLHRFSQARSDQTALAVFGLDQWLSIICQR